MLFRGGRDLIALLCVMVYNGVKGGAVLKVMRAAGDGEVHYGSWQMNGRTVVLGKQT